MNSFLRYLINLLLLVIAVLILILTTRIQAAPLVVGPNSPYSTVSLPA